ncbi:MAG: sigma-54-dependent Fis family transcriptional regulator, partial [Myxococcales bacterium]|nr:sigma-54-dependent Fis family transcriptional regulator [Myxococcales bacterium]
MPSLPPETVSCEIAPSVRQEPWICRLSVVAPRELRGVIALDEAPRTIGRQADPPLGSSVPHRTVSRRHLEFRWDPKACRHLVRDLGSRNGSAIFGQPLGELPRVLDDNAVLRFGDVVAVYERRRGPLVDPPTVDRAAVPGEALAIVALRAAIARAARDPSPVLLIGESGSGKERCAAELHRLSRRRGPLVTLNCAALSPQLIESQLFGHQRGAFTGATQSQVGLFRAADGGTLFLDEIGELPLDLQPKLLRAIESGEILPLGTTTHLRVDARVIAATNRDLAAMVDAGEFRRDLHARLALWNLEVPALARRRVDILEWIERLATIWAAERGLERPPRIDLTPAAAALVVGHRWPDNLRGVHRLIHELAHREGEGALPEAVMPEWLKRQVASGEAPPASAAALTP